MTAVVDLDDEWWEEVEEFRFQWRRDGWVDSYDVDDDAAWDAAWDAAVFAKALVEHHPGGTDMECSRGPARRVRDRYWDRPRRRP